jgi:hypothetical protein
VGVAASAAFSSPPAPSLLSRMMRPSTACLREQVAQEVAPSRAEPSQVRGEKFVGELLEFRYRDVLHVPPERIRRLFEWEGQNAPPKKRPLIPALPLTSTWKTRAAARRAASSPIPGLASSCTFCRGRRAAPGRSSAVRPRARGAHRQRIQAVSDPLGACQPRPADVVIAGPIPVPRVTAGDRSIFAPRPARGTTRLPTSKRKNCPTRWRLPERGRKVSV